jgi:hypothetical protein
MGEEETKAMTGFDEWIVTKALAEHLKVSGPAWLFDLKARTRTATETVHGLCGFRADEARGGSENMIRRIERGAITKERFDTYFKFMTPDLRWSTLTNRELVWEFKGFVKPSARSAAQAQRYFRFFAERPCDGAVIYAVPEAGGWIDWLDLQAVAAKAEGVPHGVVEWSEILSRIVGDLDMVIERAELKLSRFRFMVNELKAGTEKKEI